MADFYDKVNQKIIEFLEQGHTAWLQPWKVLNAQNPITKNVYKGRNRLLLNMAPFDSCNWVTFREVQLKQGRVIKDASSWPIVWFDWIGGEKEPEKPRSEWKGAHPFLAGHNMFNIEQTTGMDYPNPPMPLKTFNPIEAAEKIVKGYKADIRYGGNQACYHPAEYYISMPKQERFESEEDFYLVLFHEIAHSTKHELKRPQFNAKGSKSYAFEELVAQITASYLAEQCNLNPQHLEQSAAYIEGWIPQSEWKNFLCGDKNFFIKATTEARKALVLITGAELKEGEE